MTMQSTWLASRVNRLKEQVAAVPTHKPPPALSEDKACEYGPLLLEFLRLALAEWRRPGASATPQNLSLVLMRAEQVIDDANYKDTRHGSQSSDVTGSTGEEGRANTDSLRVKSAAD